jgi:phenylacetate-CoA ligase
MHVLEDHFIVEILNQSQPAAPGKPGRIVVTDLTNRAMPLIRYEVGDVGRWCLSACSCGRTTRRLAVLGRVAETLDSPHGALTPSEVADTFFADSAISNFRLEERGEGDFDVSIVPNPDAGTPDTEMWKERFARLHGSVRRLRTRVVPFVRPEASGKYRLVHRRPGAALPL